MGIVETIALTMGVAWASGINLYAAIAVLGILGATGNLILPQDLEVLADPLVIGAACFMYFVEFFADKTPGVDTGWDAIHTFIGSRRARCWPPGWSGRWTRRWSWPPVSSVVPWPRAPTPPRPVDG